MYRGQLQRDFAVWVEKGLVSRETADGLLAEYDGREQSFTVGRVLMMLAAVLVGAAILLFIAANWDGIPRGGRAALLIGLIWLFHAGAAFTGGRQTSYVSGALLVLGASTFGASLALVAQMYNLSGDNVSAAMVWLTMTAATALLFRSAALTYYAGLLGWLLFAAVLGDGWGTFGTPDTYAPPLAAIGVIAMAYYTGGMRARHLCYLLLLTWLGWGYVSPHGPFNSWLFVAAGLILFLLATVPASPLHAAARRAGAAPAFYSFLLALMGLGLYQVEHGDLFSSDATSLSTALPSMATATLAVLAIALAGRDNAAVRYTGYVTFALEILYLSIDMIGTIIGTSGVFLLSGVFLALIAYLVIRLERRFSAASAAKGA